MNRLDFPKSLFPVRTGEVDVPAFRSGAVAANAATPSCVTVVVGADAAALECWAERQRVDLGRLAELLREMQVEAEAAERACDSYEHMLATVKAQLDVEVEVVRSQAAVVATAAAEEATKMLLPQGVVCEPTKGSDDRVVKHPTASQGDDALGCEVGLGDLAEVYTWFWRDTAEQPVVDRLRRLVRRGAQ